MNWSYPYALEYLYGFHQPERGGATPAERAARLLGEVRAGIVRRCGRVVHVVGTNGKGATAVYIESALTSAGHETLCLVSPHTNSVRERIRINGEPVIQPEFIRVLRELSPALERIRNSAWHPSPVTIITAMSVLLRAELGSGGVGIFEVGKGGASDATNVFEEGDCASTIMGGDHCDEFGGTLEGLALEKLGLCRPDGALYFLPQALRVRRCIAEVCRERRCRAVEVSRIDEAITDMALAMQGHWQYWNCSLALAVAMGRGSHQLDREAIVRAVLPRRCEHRCVGSTEVILDGCHNPTSLRLFLAYVAKTSRASTRRCAIIGLSQTKQWRRMLRQVIQSELFRDIVVTESLRPGGVPPSELAFCCEEAGVRAMSAPSLLSALRQALTISPDVLTIFGSFWVCADFDRALHGLGLSAYAAPLGEIDPWQPWMHKLA